MVEIFKTDVRTKRVAERVLRTLRTHLPLYHFNFDLEDCDRILRVQSNGLAVETMQIIQIVAGQCIGISLYED
jgi:hypothetical protein